MSHFHTSSMEETSPDSKTEKEEKKENNNDSSNKGIKKNTKSSKKSISDKKTLYDEDSSHSRQGTKTINKNSKFDKGLRRSWDEHYENCGDLGRGGVARVIKGKNKKTGSFKSIKLPLNIKTEATYNHEIKTLNEINPILEKNKKSVKSLNLPHVEHNTIISDYANGGDLKNHILKQTSTNTSTKFDSAIRTAIQMTKSVKLMHAAGCFHGDIKPANFLRSINWANTNTIEKIKKQSFMYEIHLYLKEYKKNNDHKGFIEYLRYLLENKNKSTNDNVTINDILDPTVIEKIKSILGSNDDLSNDQINKIYLLVDKCRSRVKLSDFGSAQAIVENNGKESIYYSYDHTKAFVPPEFSKHVGEFVDPEIAFARDVYSLGLSILCLFLKIEFPKENYIDGSGKLKTDEVKAALSNLYPDVDPEQIKSILGTICNMTADLNSRTKLNLGNEITKLRQIYNLKHSGFA